MYINDVVRFVRSIYPSEYDAAEIYIWCNEVSAMLSIEERNVFKSVLLPVLNDGSVMLPEGVDNLLVASGKSVSAVPQTMLRYQSAGMSLGQAAGAAAGLAAKEGVTVRELAARDMKGIQEELLSQNVYLGTEERLKELGLAEKKKGSAEGSPV